MAFDVVLKSLLAPLDAAALGYDILWENTSDEFHGARLPCLAVSMAQVNQQRLTFDSTTTITVILQVTVIDRERTGAFGAIRIAEEVLALYPPDAGMHDDADGSAVVSELGSVGPGFRDGDTYRLPVSIPFFLTRRP